MVYALLQLTVSDVEAFWREFQNRGYVLRQAAGSLGMEVFTLAGEPTQVIVLGHWDSRAHLEQFLQRWRAFGLDPAACGATIQSLHWLDKLGELDA